MIKKFALLFLLGVLVFSSCKKDDDVKDTVDSNKLSGEWTLVSYRADDGVQKSTVAGTTTTSTFTWLAKDIVDTKVTFKDDKTYTGAGSYTLETKTTTSGQVVDQDIPVSFDVTGTWKLDGDVLETTDSGGDNAKGKILILDDHNLKTELKATKNQTVGGFTVVSSQTVIAVYTR